jgi:hypothetical protein
MRKTGKEMTEIALIQLRRAIQLFNSGDFVCSATLAGAAEEILGKIAGRRYGLNALEADAEFLGQVADLFGKPRPDLKKVAPILNRHRNTLKHNDSGENAWYEAHFAEETQNLIDRGSHKLPL